MDPEEELLRYDESHFTNSAERPRWLILNKIDQWLEEEQAEHIAALTERFRTELDFQGPIFAVSALNKQGTTALVWAIMEFMEAARAATHHPNNSVRAVVRKAAVFSPWRALDWMRWIKSAVPRPARNQRQGAANIT